MKTKCMSCGGTTKKMQKGGSTDSTRTAPYVSPKGAFYPDKKSLESGCAKNPNSPECKKVIKTMSPAEAAKIKGRLQKGGAIKKMKTGGAKPKAMYGMSMKPTMMKRGGTKKQLMAKQMLKRKDGSYSQRGLWDNIRDAKGSGKKPTKEMLKKEKKIKATTKKKK